MKMLERFGGGYLKRMGWWVLAYVAVKWTLLGGLVFWLSRYEWFRFEYLGVVPVLVVSGVGIKWVLGRWQVGG